MTRLDHERVTELFLKCLFQEGEDSSNRVRAEGITLKVGFHPVRLEGHKREISELLDELPDEFKSSGGEGMSFLQACNDRHGNQWTGLHHVMEQLFLLGIAIGKVKCLTPREVWKALPGGMPFYAVQTG